MIVVGGWPGRHVVGLNGHFGVRAAGLASGTPDPNPFLNNFDVGDDPATEMVVVVTALPASGTVTLADDGDFTHAGAADGTYHTLGTVYSWAPGGPLIQHGTQEDITTTFGSSTNTDLFPGVGHLAFSGKQPTLSQTANQAVSPGAGHLIFVGRVPGVTQGNGVSLFPDTGHLSFGGKVPTIGQTANQAVAPSPGHLVFAGYQPSVAQSGGRDLFPGTGHLTLEGNIPTVRQNGGGLPSVIAPGRIYHIKPDAGAPSWMAAAGVGFVLDKDPQATLDYGFDWALWEAEIPGDPITDFTITGNLELAVLDVGIVGGIYAAMVTGGFDGSRCELTCHVETLEGRADERTIILNVRNR